MIDYLGTLGNLALFSDGEQAVVVNTQLSLIAKSGHLSTFSEQFADSFYEDPSAEAVFLVNGYFDVANSKAVTASASRMYTIPGGVQAEAKKALEWRREAKRGGTPVGLNTARTLAKGGQIGIEKIRHIAKYFPRHEVDKKGKGWAPGEEHFPSNGRIAWALWGGDAGQRWASAIVERENKKAMLASGYDILGVDAPSIEMNTFKELSELDPTCPEFIIRVRMDGTGIDRLYKAELDGSVFLWDGIGWETLGHVDGDIYTYDLALDDAYDMVEKDYFIVDPSSAVVISALLRENPFACVSVEDIDANEADMFNRAAPEIDGALLDLAITAAVPATTETISGKSDGKYTPEERSSNATNQLRDATGRFASTGSRVVVGGDRSRGSGVVTKADPTSGIVTVKLDGGKTVQVGAKYTQAESTVPGYKLMPEPSSVPLDTSGILGKPRMPEGSTGARLPGTMAPISTKDIHNVINNWPKYVKDARDSFNPLKVKDIKKFADSIGKKIVPGGPGIDEINK